MLTRLLLSAKHLSPRQCKRRLSAWRIAATVIAIGGGGAGSIVFASYHADMNIRCNRIWAVVLASLWTFLPSAWLMLEWCYLFPAYGNHANEDDLKYGQGLATKLWAGIAVVLAIAYQTWKPPQHEPPTPAGKSVPATTTTNAPTRP